MATRDMHPAVMATAVPIPALAPVSWLTRLPPAAAAGKPDQALAPRVDVLPPRAWRNPYKVSNNCQPV